jgi:hypothetical protein
MARGICRACRLTDMASSGGNGNGNWIHDLPFAKQLFEAANRLRGSVEAAGPEALTALVGIGEEPRKHFGIHDGLLNPAH